MMFRFLAILFWAAFGVAGLLAELHKWDAAIAIFTLAMMLFSFVVTLALGQLLHKGGMK